MLCVSTFWAQAHCGLSLPTSVATVLNSTKIIIHQCLNFSFTIFLPLNFDHKTAFNKNETVYLCYQIIHLKSN